ncbi:type II toxin-antitoxin system RelB/DinJ family antitoxin [Streptococcus plurextorum]|uniref:type II toxin-antitoxin system RelB/ParD family antitoxin n=1 Tax=Streptococcus plurextorum TaxID=456876 RepID=UPI0003FAB376|nr:type II toxin-antitoxin system RelB/DinJ family antitoxin [Streptococcus plurextorum]
MATLTRDRQYNFRVNAEMLEQAKSVLESKDISVSDALNLFLKNVAVTQQVDLKTDDELEKEQLFKQLQAEVQNSIDEMNAGTYYTEEELRASLGI